MVIHGLLEASTERMLAVAWRNHHDRFARSALISAYRPLVRMLSCVFAEKHGQPRRRAFYYRRALRVFSESLDTFNPVSTVQFGSYVRRAVTDALRAIPPI